MRGRLRLAGLGLGLALVAAGSSGTAASGPQTRAAAPVYGVLTPMKPGRPTEVVRLDSRTLAPLGGRRVALQEGLGLALRSPDGRFAAFVAPRRPAVRLVDLAEMRARPAFRLPLDSHWRLRAAAWPTADRIVVVAQRMRGSYDQIVAERHALVVDPLARRIVARRPIADAGAILASATGGDRLVLLIGRADLRGRGARIAVVDSAGLVRSAPVDVGGAAPRTLPSLAVEPAGRRAVLVAAAAAVTEVDLDRMTVTVHAVNGGGAVFRAAGLAARQAVWVGDGALAVTGSNAAREQGVETSRPVGLALVDTTTWQARVVDPGAGGVSVSRATLLAYGMRVDPGPGGRRERQRLSGIGVRAYDLDGRRRWARFGGEAASAHAFRDRVLAYRVPVLRAGTPFVVLDLATGREVGRPRRGSWFNLSVLPDVAGAAGGLRSARRGEPALRIDGDAESFTGTTRADVTRVVAVLADGRTRELQLEDGAVEHRAESPEAAARAVHAYAGEQLAASVELPLRCGGAAGPCGSAIVGADGPVYAFLGELPAGGASLARVDPRTLRPLGRPLVLRERLAPWYARSPDGRFLAVAVWDRPVVRIVDLDRLALVGTVALGGGAGTSVRVLAWPRDDRLLAVTQRLSLPTRRYVRERTLVAVDPAARQVVARRPLTKTLAVHGAEAAGGRLVLQLRSSSRRGSTVEIVVADASGAVRSRRVEVGRTGGALNETALVVEPSGRRAFILGWALGRRTPPVLEIDLRSLAVRAQRLQVAGAGALARAGASTLSARAVDDRRLVALGGVSSPGREVRSSVPASGLFLVDTQSWVARLLDPRPSYVDVHEGKLVTYGPNTRLLDARRPSGRGSGITAYDTSGRRLYHLYGSRPFSRIELAGAYGHVLLGRGRARSLVFDVRAGRALGTLPAPSRPVEVLAAAPTAPGREPQPSRAVASATQPDPFRTVSNRGTRVAAVARSPGEREHVPRELYLLRRAEGLVVYRIGGLRRGVRACYGSGRADRIGVLGSLSCGQSPFPSRRLPVFDMSAVQLRRGSTRSRLWRLAGVAADAVTEIGLTDASGAVVARVPVERNVYALAKPPDAATGRILAFDRAGNVVYRNDRPPRPAPPPSNPRLLAGYRIELTLPSGWFGRVGRSPAGPARAALTAADFPLPRGALNRVPTGRTLVRLTERDPRARPSYPRVAARITAAAVVWVAPTRSTGRRTFTRNGRQFELRVDFGTGRPSTQALARVNRVLATLEVGAIAVAPTGVPSARPLQQASADGVEVAVYRSGAVVFRFTSAFPTHLLRGRRATLACLTFDSTSPWETNELWVSRPFEDAVRIELGAGPRRALPYATLDAQTTPKPPLDGCLVSGPYGRRWNDPRGQRSPAEIAFTPTGRRFFDERAVARDLALFVRSPVLAAVRRAMKRGTAAPPATAIARRLPDRVVPLGARLATPAHDRIGLWTDGASTIVVSERSPAGKRLWIEVRGGRIARHNLAGLAFVF